MISEETVNAEELSQAKKTIVSTANAIETIVQLTYSRIRDMMAAYEGTPFYSRTYEALYKINDSVSDLKMEHWDGDCY